MLYHSARGDVGYTIVGTPTIVDGVVSGFTTTDYITTQSTPQDTDVRNYELFTKIKINSIPTTTEFIMCYQAGSREGISIINGGRIRFQTSRSIGTTGEPSIFSSACSVGDEVLIHTYYKGNNIWVLEISKDNGVTWETNTLTVTSELSEIDTSKVITIGGSPFYSSGYKSPFVSGSIDLNHTYIKVNGQPWFGICPVEVKKHQLMGPVGYTVVGSPTITDGVASGFSSSNYLELSQQANNSIPFEMVVCFAANSVTTTNNGFVICAVGDAQMYINTHSQLGVKYSTGSNKWITEPTILSANTKYWGKFTYDGTQVGISISTDGTQFTTPTTQENNPRDRATASRFGFPYSGYQLFDGSIDLNNTYIKVNGKLWFWQPRETEKIVVNGVEVWQKSS